MATDTRSIIRVVGIVAACVLALFVVYRVSDVLVSLFLACFLAVALAPLVSLVQRKTGGRRSVAVVLVALMMIAFILGLLALIVPIVINGVQEFIHNYPALLEKLNRQEWYAHLDAKYDFNNKIEEELTKIPQHPDTAVLWAKTIVVGTFGAMIKTITIFVMTMFLLLDGDKFVFWALKQLPEDQRRRWGYITGRSYRAVGGYILGASCIALLGGVLSFVVMSLLGIPFAPLLAIIVAICSFIPIVGGIISGLIVAVVAAAFGDFPTAIILWLVYFTTYQQLEGHFIQPLIYKKTVELHPLLVIVAVLIGSSQMGILGALLAIPVAACLQIIAADYWGGKHLAEPQPHTDEEMKLMMIGRGDLLPDQSTQRPDKLRQWNM